MIRQLAAAIALGALTACGSSGRYGSPGYAAAAVGAGAVGAAVSRAAGGCYATCAPGTHCNAATGLCVSGTEPLLPASPGSPSGPSSPVKRRPVPTMSTAYPAGHEFEVPPIGDADAGCAPAAVHGEDGGVACEMDAGTI
jgi:hypothetical protein